jgi:hypothetical protein
VPAHFHERASAPERKPWMSEDPRMAIFDAAAFALVLFEIKTGLLCNKLYNHQGETFGLSMSSSFRPRDEDCKNF